MAAAFEYYYFQGEGRTLRAVANQFKKSEQAVNTWAQTFRWKQRVVDRDTKAAAALRAKGDEEAVKIREQELNVGKRVLARFAARLATPAERAKMGKAFEDATDYEPNASDAARWASLLLLLSGHATGRTEHTAGPGLIDAFAAGVVATLRKHLDAATLEKVSHEILEQARLLTTAAEAAAGTTAAPQGHA